MRLYKIWTSVRTGVWLVPVLCVVAGMGLSFATVAIDRQFDFELLPEWITGGPDAALAILSTVAASMVSLAALVLTITMVVVQLAMGQFSPRIVQTILQDKPSQLAIGVFVGTFAHAMLAMREVSFDGGGRVPGLAIAVAFVLVLVSIAVLVVYVEHIGRSLRVASLIELVGTSTRTLLDELYPDRGSSEEAADPGVVVATHSGVVSHIHHDALVRIAQEARCTLVMIPALGDFVPGGAPLFRVEGDPQALRHSDVTGVVVLSLERLLEQDVAYGLRQLVDIAERSMADSPFQDPTTAVQAIDRLHDCLRQIARRPFPGGEHVDGDGQLRLVVPSMDWDAYVHLAFDEIRVAGAGSPQVSRRLRAALEDLLEVAPPERKPVLRDQLDRLEQLTDKAMQDERDVELATRPDSQGLGRSAGAHAG